MQGILQEHLPAGFKVWVFGSRADWSANDASDLDLAVEDNDKLSYKLLDTLKDAFDNSTLPYTVDVVDLNRISGSFKQIVESQRVSLPIDRDRTKQRTPPSSTPASKTTREETPLTTTPGKWRRVALNDLIDLQLSSVDKKSKANERAVQLCNYMDVYKNSFIHTGMDFMAATATEREIAKCSLSAGDVVITKDSEKHDDIGVPALVREDIPNLVCGYHLAILRPRLSQIDGTYLFYALNACQVQQQFHSFANGVTRFGLRKADIGLVEIPLPPFSEQRTIAHILSTLDDKIELNRRMSETLEEVAKALFKSWFIDFDPVQAKMKGWWRQGESLHGLPANLYDLFPSRLVDSELGPIPEGWQIKQIKDIAEHLRDTADPRDSPQTLFSHFSIPAYDSNQMPVHEYGSCIKSRKTVVRPGVTLISRLNPETERVWLTDVKQNEQAVCSTEFLMLNPISPFTSSYIYCLARSTTFRRGLVSLVTGTSKSHQRAPVKAVLSMRVLMPPKHIVATFDSHVKPILDSILITRSESSSLANSRRYLLPRLISGEL